MTRRQGLSVLFWCFVAVACLEIYSVFPREGEFIYPFPLDSQGLRAQNYADYLGTRLAICILLYQVYILMRKVGRFEQQLLIFFWLSVGYLIDFCIRYNNPFAGMHIGNHVVPISYTLVMIGTMIFVIAKTYFDD